MSVVGNNIKRVRKSLGISKSELARRVMVTPTAVHSWEEYGSSPRAELLPVVAAALGVPPAVLSGDAQSAATATATAEARRAGLLAVQDLKERLAALYGVGVDKITVSISF